MCPAQVSEVMSQIFFAGTVQQQNAPAEVRGDQTTAHRVNDVFGEILKTEKFLALLFELHALLAKRLRQETGQIGHRKKPQKIHDQPGTKALRRRQAGEGARNLLRVSHYGHDGKEDKTDRRDQKSDSAGKQDAGDDNHQQIEQDEITLLETGRIHQQGNHHHIARDLQAGMPPRLREPAQKDEVQDSESDPEDDKQQG